MAFKDYDTDYKAPRIPSGEFHIDGKESLEINYIYEGILHRNKFLLESGSDYCQLYHIKLTGERCTNPECPAFDNYQQAGSTSCNVCFGSGFVGGYDYIEELYIRFPPEMEQINITPEGLMRVVKPRIWTMPEPQLRQFDILINYSHPQVTQEKTEVDKLIYREVGTEFDSLNETINEFRQVIRILKISDNRNSSEDYKENIDYVLSNDGILWKTDNKPIDDDEYFVTYQISHRYYRRYEINTVTPSRWRGKTLHQDLEVTELPLDHPSYFIPQQGLSTSQWATVYDPFPKSKWYDRE